jgi:hypothetical protein
VETVDIGGQVAGIFEMLIAFRRQTTSRGSVLLYRCWLLLKLTRKARLRVKEGILFVLGHDPQS